MIEYTRAELVSDVRTLLDDSQYSATTITTAANWFVHELAQNNRLRLFEASDDLYGSSGDTFVELPDDIMTMVNFYLTSPAVYDLMSHYCEYGDFMRNFPNYATASQAQALEWTDFGNGVRFSRPLNADHTFTLDYMREPNEVSQDSDVFEVPGRYKEMLAKGTLVRIMEMNEDYAEASNERKNLEPLVTAFVRLEGRGQIKTGPTVIRTNRRRTGGMRPGVVRDW